MIDDKNDLFIVEDFRSSRQETTETKKRLFILFIFNISFLFILFSFFEESDLLFFAPFICISISTVYMSENHNLMRLGRRVKERIEPRYNEKNGYIGWETWLSINEEGIDKRTVDKLLSFSTGFSFLVNMGGALFLLYNHTKNTFSYVDTKNNIVTNEFACLIILTIYLLVTLYAANKFIFGVKNRVEE